MRNYLQQRHIPYLPLGWTTYCVAANDIVLQVPIH